MMTVFFVGIKATIHFPTQSCDPISCYGKPVERTNEIGLEMISLVPSTVSRCNRSDLTTESESGWFLGKKSGQHRH